MSHFLYYVCCLHLDQLSSFHTFQLWIVCSSYFKVDYAFQLLIFLNVNFFYWLSTILCSSRSVQSWCCLPLSWLYSLDNFLVPHIICDSNSKLYQGLYLLSLWDFDLLTDVVFVLPLKLYMACTVMVCSWTVHVAFNTHLSVFACSMLIFLAYSAAL